MLPKSLRVKSDILRRYISLPNEKLLLATRTHWICLLPSALILFFFSLAASVLISTLFVFLTFHPIFLISSVLLCWLSGFAFFAIAFARWYYHCYIVTTRKIIEISQLPFFFHSVNDVLLDQVRCTEVDVKKTGLLNEIVNKGDITITFDRPTNQEEFVLKDVSDPEKTGIFLGDNLDRNKQKENNLLWYRQSKTGSGYHFTEEINPPPTLMPLT